MANVLLSSEEAEHGTPPEYVELARYVMGGIDLDPASSSYWNHHVVKAGTFYDERINGLEQRWFGRVLLNAPSSKKKDISVRPFWERLAEYYTSGEIDSALYIGFQLGQLTLLQSSPTHPLQYVNLFPRDRIRFLMRTPGNGPPVRGTQPTHGNFVTLLPCRSSATVARGQLARFMERAQDLEIGGAIVRPML